MGLTIWCINASLRSIPSWGSDLFTTTGCTIQPSQNLYSYKAGRCMLPVRTKESVDDKPVLPTRKQPSLWSISLAVRRIVIVIWLLALLALIWFLAILLVSKHTVDLEATVQYDVGHDSWYFTLDWFPVYNNHTGDVYNVVQFSELLVSLVPEYILGTLFLFAIQAL